MVGDCVGDKRHYQIYSHLDVQKPFEMVARESLTRALIISPPSSLRVGCDNNPVKRFQSSPHQNAPGGGGGVQNQKFLFSHTPSVRTGFDFNHTPL